MERDGLFQDARYIVNTVFDQDPVKANPNFRLFLSGFFYFFYDEGGPDDWCDNFSFALRYNNRPMLSLALRKRINSLIYGLNKGIEAGIRNSWYPERTSFIDTYDYTDNRFCQPGHTILDQYLGDKVSLWNMSPEGLLWGDGETLGADSPSGTYTVRQPTPAEFDRWYKTGRFTDTSHEVVPDTTTLANAKYGLADEPIIAGPCQNWGPGAARRPFHPREKAYSRMANMMKEAIRRETWRD
jgi:hypothetical protein